MIRKPGRKKSIAPIATIPVPPPQPEVIEAPVEKRGRRSIVPAAVEAAVVVEPPPPVPSVSLAAAVSHFIIHMLDIMNLFHPYVGYHGYDE